MKVAIVRWPLRGCGVVINMALRFFRGLNIFLKKMLSAACEDLAKLKFIDRTKAKQRKQRPARVVCWIVITAFFGKCGNNFRGRSSSLSLYNSPEGNSLAATEFVRLLEVSGSVTAKQTNGTRENTQSLGSNSKV